MKNHTGHLTLVKSLLLSGACVSAMAVAMPANAQTGANAEPEEIVVTGTRRVIQDTIALKRNNVQVVDGLFADEIGELPALSIGEALESISGVTSHRENGGATEVSVRGLGPYLSSTTINGRLVGNGSGNRAVNFSQFPSELFNKLAVYKTQDASQIEGGVAGQIQIETLKPLDYGKQRLQFEVKGNVNPDQLDIEDSDVGDIGYRGTISYVDQIETGAGDVGFSIGLQSSKISQPEAEYTTSSNTGSSHPACLLDVGQTNILNPEGEAATGFTNNPSVRNRDGRINDDDCDDVNTASASSRDFQGGEIPRGDTEGFDNSLGPNGLVVDGGAPFVFAPSSRQYRQNDTSDERNAVFGAVQWQPNDRLDINFDAGYSVRTQNESRNTFIINEGRENTTQGLNVGLGTSTTTLDTLEYRNNGYITSLSTQGPMTIGNSAFEREETYAGFGLNAAYEVNDRLTVSADLAYSEVERDETEIYAEFRSGTQDYTITQDGSNAGLLTLYDGLDVTDGSQFANRLLIRVDRDWRRENDYGSLKFDADYDVGGDFFTSVEAGFRYAQQGFLQLDGGDDISDWRNLNSTAQGRFSIEIESNNDLEINNVELVDNATNIDETLWTSVIASSQTGCLNGAFPQSGFLSNVRNGNLITLADGTTGAVATSVNEFATFDARCVVDNAVTSLNAVLPQINQAIFDDGDGSRNSLEGTVNAVAGFDASIPDIDPNSARTIDLTEDTTALYAMANYETTFDGLPVRGNLGLRVVHTEVESKSFREDYSITPTGDGGFSIAATGDVVPVSETFDYTEFLPSATFIMDVNDDVLFRAGVFRALSRANPSGMGYNRVLTPIPSDEEVTDPDQLLTNVNARGNPSFEPLTSWNYDLGVEWYPNEDSFLALGAYYKSFKGGFENVTQNETYNLNGTATVFPVSGLVQTSEEESGLFGIEVTGSHRFSYLPGYFSGLGVKGSYNWVNSDFEFQDGNYGQASTRDINGNTTIDRLAIIPSADIPGLSENVFTGTAYYSWDKFDASVIYKYRDSYLQPYTTCGDCIRYVGERGLWEARASYKINDNFRVSLEALNITDEPRTDSVYVHGNTNQVLTYGPRVFFGLRGKF